MAKHRRPLPKRALSRAVVRRANTRQTVAASAGPKHVAAPRNGRARSLGAARSRSRNISQRALDPRPGVHDQAVRTYERALEALQQHKFARATELLESVLLQFPEEKELHERVRLYLNVCQRQAAPPDRTPKTLEERVYAATLAINAGSYDHGLSQLQLALEADSANDHVHYMLAVVHALRLDFAASMAHLQRAIEINPDNRFLAMQDADLVGLREADAGFRAMVDAAFAARRDRRETRPRTSR